MHDFKVGDRVEYVGTVFAGRKGKHGVVAGIVDSSASVRVEFDGDGHDVGCWPKSLRLITPAPDVITIDRADLPEVTDVGGSLHSGTSDYFTDPEFGAAKHRRLALQQLAVAEFLEAREKAAEEVAVAVKEAADKLTQRRDDLANELAPRYDTKSAPTRYDQIGTGMQRAIDRIIELEDSRA